MVIGTAFGFSDLGTIALAVALVVAGLSALPVNRWLIARGKGHAVVHETGIHGGVPPRLVAVVAAIAFAFGVVTLVTEAGDTEPAHGDGHAAVRTATGPAA